MSELQTAYDIVGIVFMGLMLIITLSLVIAVFVIRAKVNAIHDRVIDKLDLVTEWAEKGSSVIGAIKKVSKKSHK